MSNKLYVANISYNATAFDLGKLFEQIGPVTNASIAESNGKSLGFGFVILADGNAARTAVERLNGTELLNRPIKVEIARENSGERRPFNNFRGRGRGGGSEYGQRNDYNNSGGRSEYGQRNDYNNGGGRSDYGQRNDYNNGGGRSDYGQRNDYNNGGGFRGRGRYGGRGGYGGDRDGTGYEGRGGYGGYRGGYRGGRGGRGGFRPRTPIDEDTPRSQTQVHIGNLAWVTTVEELRGAFEGFDVKEVTIPQNNEGRSFGFGLVDFSTNEDQKRALDRGRFKLHDREVVISPAVIRKPREERREGVQNKE